MKKNLKFIILLLLIVPMFTHALSFTDYDSSISNVNNYINSFSDRNKYLTFERKYDFKNGQLSDNTLFKTGGLLSQDEYYMSVLNNYSYLATGKEYWTLTGAGTNQYYIDATILSKNKGESSGVRVTEFVKNTVRVNGKGTYSNPWVFRNEYSVDVRTNSTDYGTVEPVSQMVPPDHATTDITLTEKTGYMYVTNDCGLTKVRNEGNNKVVFKINKVNKDTSCVIVLGDRKVNVTYDCNGGTGSTLSQLFKYGENYKLNNTGCLRTGFHQDGWVTSDNTKWNEAESGTWSYDNGQRGVANNNLALKAVWKANDLVFNNQSKSFTYDVSTQSLDISAATNGTGNYTYTEKSEKNASGTSTNYVSISGTKVNLVSAIPAGTYTYVINVKDNVSLATKDATYTITINRKAVTVTAATSSRAYNGSAYTNATCTVTAGGLLSGHTLTCAMTSGSTITNAGSVANTINTVTIKNSGGTSVTTNYNITKVAGTLTVTKANSTAPTLTASTVNYNGSSHCVGVSGGTSGLTKQYAYRTWNGSSYGSWSSWGTASSNYCATNAGQWEIKARVAGNDNYNTSSESTAVVLKVNKVAATLTCSNKNYTGSAQTGCSCTGGTVGGTNTATNAGTYTVSCSPDSNHTAPSNKTWTINKVSATLTCSNKNYTGSAQTGCSCTGGTVGGTYSATKAGTYTASCTGDANHTAPSNKTWTINKVSATLTCSNKNYTGSAQTGCSCTGGTVGGTYSATNAGTYTASCTGDKNHSNPSNKTWTINKATPSVSVSLTYAGKKVTAVASSSSSGTLSYQWYVNSTGKKISGATSKTFEVTSDYYDKVLKVEVTVAATSNYNSHSSVKKCIYDRHDGCGTESSGSNCKCPCPPALPYEESGYCRKRLGGQECIDDCAGKDKGTCRTIDNNTAYAYFFPFNPDAPAPAKCKVKKITYTCDCGTINKRCFRNSN